MQHLNQNGAREIREYQRNFDSWHLKVEAPNLCPQNILHVEELNNQMHSEHPSIEITPEQCATEVLETIPSVMQSIRVQMRRNGSLSLSVPQFRALVFLYSNPGCSLSSLADHLGVTRPTASAITERLVQRGFVDRTEHPQERRQVVLKLTEAGFNHFQQIRETTRDYMAGRFANLSEAQRQCLVEGLAILKDVFNYEKTTAQLSSSEPGKRHF